MMGRKDLPGRPMIYGTTKAFLEIFGLNAISDLPNLKEVVPPQGGQEAPKTEEETPSKPGPSPVESEIEEVLEEIDPSGIEDGS